MNFIIKQKVIDLKERYVIENENGEIVYKVYRQVISLKRKWFFVDARNNQRIQIENIVFTYPAKFKIAMYDGNRVNVNKKFKFFGDVLEIESSWGNYTLAGNKITRKYEITKDGEFVGVILKKRMSIGDIYYVQMNDNENADFILSIAIVLDAVHE